MSAEHTSVLLKPACDALLWDLNGIYADGTFGRGGHSRCLLSGLSSSAVLHGFDKDPLAVEEGRELEQLDQRFHMNAGSFTGMQQLASDQQLEGRFAGILLDLGVSSPQLDNAERGFSFMNDGPLDMRMDPNSGVSAAEWLADADQQDVADVLKTYGEERYAKRIAAAICDARALAPITRTGQLAELIKVAHPRWEKDKHPATKSFQAIRIFINRELEELELMLDLAVRLLCIQGRLVVISFHSLEDRITKRFMRQASRSVNANVPRNIPIKHSQGPQPPLRLLGKAVRCSDAERRDNRRARSAIMRVAEKVASAVNESTVSTAVNP